MTTPVSPKLFTDAVVASYIHDISTRHRPEEPAEGPRSVPSASEREE